MVKNLPSNAGDTRDVVSSSGWGRSPGDGNGNPSSILAWKAPWTEEPGRLHPRGHKELDTTKYTQTTHVSEEHLVLKNNQLQILKIKSTFIKIKTS